MFGAHPAYEFWRSMRKKRFRTRAHRTGVVAAHDSAIGSRHNCPIDVGPIGRSKEYPFAPQLQD